MWVLNRTVALLNRVVRSSLLRIIQGSRRDVGNSKEKLLNDLVTQAEHNGGFDKHSSLQSGDRCQTQAVSQGRVSITS